MKVKQLTSELKEFYSMIKVKYSEIDLNFLDCIEGSDYWDHCEALQDKHGIYIFADHSDEILYIGKADLSHFNTRVWTHLGKPDKQAVNIYPSGKFANKKKWRGEAAEKIIKGQFSIYGVSIAPNYWASIFEVFSQTIVMKNDKKRPPFNFRIG